MRPTLCARCKKNVAVIFITKVEGNQTTNEGICLKCAKELGIKPVTDMIERMGISDEDIENMSGEMMSNLPEGLLPLTPAENEDAEGDDAEGKTATFPFLNKLFGPIAGQNPNADASGDNQKKSAPNGMPKRKFLDAYCVSLTERARQGKLDRVVGREEEIERVLQILNRRQKNNPCLLGEPGVGKTAIAEGLAIRMIEGNVPPKLADKEIYLLDLTSLVAGTQFRGQFESRMKGLIDEVKRIGNIILVIDEVHNIVGAGDSEGSMNAANILKPALSRGEIQVIGATTFADYRKFIEKDAALERRFQSVTVNEPSIDDATEILRGIAHYYETHHSVKIPDFVLRQAVILSERYITDRFLPDKAIDLIDEACSQLNLSSPNIIQLANVEKELVSLSAEREKLMNDTSEEAFEQLARIRSNELQLEQRKIELNAALPTLSVEDLARVIELWTKIPASSIKADEFSKLVGLADRLKKRVVGQDEAIAAVAAAIKRNRVGISPKHKPVSFIFAGPTGVGKTELVKCLSMDLFDSPEALIRLDMSEFMEKHSVSRIIGAPPGYVGYDEAGQLTEKIRRKPYSVILFDEIEKAHPDVLNVLLQILDDGTVTDAHGRKINFENTIIILTTNAGSAKNDGSVGFGKSVTEQSKDKALKALSEFMRPEFINRIDEVIAFNSLTRERFADIAGIMLGDLKKSLDERRCGFTWDEKVVEYLVEKSYSVKFGARNLRRTIQKEVEDLIASYLVDHYAEAVAGVALTVVDGKLSLSAI